MKKKKILVLFPILGLLLSGCTFQEGLATTKSWISQHIYHPIKDWITGGGNKEEQKDDGGDDQHEDTKVYKEIVSVKAPESIKKGETLAPSSVDLVVKYAIGTQEGTENVKAEEVVLDTSKAGDAVQGKAKYKSLEKAFTIKVTEDTPQPPVDVEEITPEKAIELCDAAGDGKVVETLYRVKGTVAFGSSKDDNGWNGKFKEKSGDKELIFGSARSETEYDTLDGATVVIEGYVELYQGAYKLSYLPASASPTKEKYNPVLVSVVPAPVKEVASIDSIESFPKTVYVGEQIDKNDVVLNVTYTDGEHAQAHPESVTVDSSQVGQVNATASIGAHSTTFPVSVIEKGKTVHAGTLEDPYTVSDAKIVFDTLEKDKNTDGEVYVTGTIAAEPAPALKGTRGLFYLTDGVCEKDLYVYNIDGINKAELTLADIPAGSVVVAKGAIKNYNGTFELCYVQDVAGCELISVEKPAGKEVVGYVPDSAVGIPESITQGKSLNKNNITFKVEYKDGSTEEVHPTSIELDTSIVAENVAGNLVYGTIKYPFTIEVTAAPVPTGDNIIFTLGEDGEATHADGTAATDNAYSETVGGVTLSLINGVKMFTGARDAHGNGCLKFGTSSAGGSFDIDLAGVEGIEKVIIRVAQYKSRNDGTIAIDGGEAYTMTKTSDAGEYDEVEVTITTQTKVSVVFAARAMVNEIEFVKSTPVVPVESVTINQEDMTIDVSVGATVLTTVVAPEEVEDSPVSWTSSEPTVATVEDGTVTPLLSGTTVITAFVDENGNGVFDSESEKSDTINITVTTILQSITIVNASPMNLVVGDSESIQVTYNPENADNKVLHYSSSNTDVAEVDVNGLVTGVGPGDAVITVNPDTSAEAKTLDVHVSDVVVPITGVSITGAPEGAIIIGQEVDLVGSVTPDNATQNPKTLSWSVVDESSEGVVTVDNGHVVAQKVGTATVRAASDFNSEFYADVEFTVEKVAVSSVTVTPGSLELTVGGQGTQLSAAVEPSNASFPEITWSSDNEEVATVSDSGVVSPVGAGETTIKATADGVVGSCTVSVEAAPIPKGTAENPYTPSELAEYASSLNLGNNAYSDSEVYVQGYVCQAGGEDTYRNYNIGDSLDAENTFIVYGVKTGGVAYENDLILAKGFIKNHNGNTLELAGNSDHAYPSIQSLTRGTSNISVVSDHATVNVVSSGTNLSQIVFTVEVEDGYEINSVKANAEALEESAGQYSFTLKGNTTITVDASEIGAAVPEVYKSVAFTSANAGSGVGSYTASVVYTDEIAVTTQNFNNNNKAWEFIKCGSKNGASTATITTNAAIDKAILEIDIAFQSVTLPNGTTAKVQVSTDSSFSSSTEYSFTPVANDTVTVKLGSGVANAYYRIVFDCTKGSGNGFIWVTSVAYKAIL